MQLHVSGNLLSSSKYLYNYSGDINWETVFVFSKRKINKIGVQRGFAYNMDMHMKWDL